jgi:hypothetical protein
VTDRLSLANALADAHIERPAAERIATEIFDAIHDSVATKSDLQMLEARLNANTAALRGELQSAVAALRSEMAQLRSEMALLEHRLLVRLGSLMVVVAGLLFAALRYLPPPH